MNQRERLLSIAVGGLVAALAISWGLGKYRAAINSRQLKLAAQQNQQTQIQETLFQGEYANRYMGEYLVRSLPSNPERAKSVYKQWLLETVINHDIDDAVISANNSRSIGGLYQRMEFRVNGRCDLASSIDLFYDFYAQDFLHRIRNFSLIPTTDGDFKLEMAIDAIALLAAAEDAPPRTSTSWRVAGEMTRYREEILNRNFFQPPNQPPQYTGKELVQATVGNKTSIPLTYQDADDHAIRFEFALPPPEAATLDPTSGVLSIESDRRQEFEILIRATDDGFPPQSSEQSLTVQIVDPPPEPQVAVKPEFDEASQTLLTGLVQGKGEWTAWLNVRTRGKTLKLRSGDQFEIGSVQGKVIDLNARRALLEIDGQRIELSQGGTLSEAVKAFANDATIQ